MTRLWRWFSYKPYGCPDCGKKYRNEIRLGRCVWKHALEV